MVITEEIVAMYIEGRATTDERKEVCRYLAKHPEIQDLILALMDDETLTENDEAETNTSSLHSEQAFTDIAYAAAAFAPKITMVNKVTQESIVNHISHRQKRMVEFWNDLKKGV